MSFEVYAALTTFFERRHRVQTLIRLMPPLIIARTSLEVRLEPPRAHVVRVAMLPADDRTFPADFTSLRHIELSAFSYGFQPASVSAIG